MDKKAHGHPRLGTGGRPVARYHLYFFENNVLLGDDRIEAADDAAAIRAAAGVQGKGKVVEVWDAQRRIRVLAPVKVKGPA